MEDFEKNITENDFLLLTEICFDEEKFKEKILDLDLYDFELNGNMFNEKIEFIYPYSYISKGNRFNLERPLLIHDNYPNQHKVIKTADNFVTCSRSILKFKKDFQIEGKNILKIVTPRKSNIYFQFHIKNGKFEIQNIEEMDIKLKVKSEA
ncbi:hypothetical protein LEP1GSC199_0605 [Leptospira vanthielii serovar Holland str. Waz Holland = ATCC 700522]|uniref:Uncharacterized protein n=2 Tax=Leptospira vanthielii TaxID=293085 RepID=N1W4D2_9LEPT|nr:hypothetical protein LEP1GSC199_0605 [Leptospira vanthielii serovar Holland str. Waz Holland = ATCC 700522]